MSRMTSCSCSIPDLVKRSKKELVMNFRVSSIRYIQKRLGILKIGLRSLIPRCSSMVIIPDILWPCSRSNPSKLMTNELVVAAFSSSPCKLSRSDFSELWLAESDEIELASKG
jgi:hypothetical protein